MSEKTIAVFKSGKDKYNLLEITIQDIGTDGIETSLTQIYYMIVKNRRRLTTTPWENTAKKKFMSIIATDLMQQKISF